MKPRLISLIWGISLAATIGLYYFPLLKDYSLGEDPAGTLMWAILMFLYAATIIAPGRFLRSIVFLIMFFYIALLIRFIIIFKESGATVWDVHIGFASLLIGLITSALTTYFITRKK
ncbi:MAG: hypothetical protein GXO48_00440 [Chlorobi bacterium]|nr:hypothetical protein [Chlorobiota bacterium]